jgi:hypothetical protein
MVISVINRTDGQVSDAEVQSTLRAINRQIVEDFTPHWSLAATLRLASATARAPRTPHVVDMSGDAVIYLWNTTDVPAALDHHHETHGGLPCGFVFTELSHAVGEQWTVTLSHEALELVADAEVNLLVMGPHPANPDVRVFHWYEMCDAVQSEAYQIDGVAVSNFVLPRYFREAEERTGRNDFLGCAHTGRSLQAFGVNPGADVGFFDPASGTHETYTIPGDTRAARRAEINAVAGAARRAGRRRAVAVGPDIARALTVPASLLSTAS